MAIATSFMLSEILRETKQFTLPGGYTLVFYLVYFMHIHIH